MKYILLFFFTLAACLIYWAMYGFPLTGIDDAQIYFVYFKNFAQGHGFVYNVPGERVEGFTSLFWALIGSGAYFLSPKNFPLILLGLNVLLCFGTFFLFDKALRLVWNTASLFPLIIFLAYIFFVPGYFEWNFIALLETSLWTFLMNASIVSLLYFQYSKRYIYLLSLLVIMLIITRPESMLWGAFMIVMLLLVQLLLPSYRSSFRFKPAAILAAAFIITLISLVAFRLMYFGYPLPNTFYAKVSGNFVLNLYGGLRYLFLVLADLPFLWIFLLASVISIVILIHKIYLHLVHNEVVTPAYGHQLILAAASFLSFLIPLYTGGDHFGMARMLQPFIPVYFLMFFNVPFWSEVSGLKPKRVSGIPKMVVYGVLIPFLYFGPSVSFHNILKEESPIATEIRIAQVGIGDAQKLNKLFAKIPKPRVGVSAAGGFAWAYDGIVVDLLGLNNVAMAHAESTDGIVKNHASFDLETLLKIRPEVFHGYAHGSAVTSTFLDTVEDAFQPLEQEEFEEKFVNQIFKGAFYEPEFVAVYKPAVVYHPEQADLIYQSYFSKEFIEQLVHKGYHVKLL